MRKVKIEKTVLYNKMKCSFRKRITTVSKPSLVSGKQPTWLIASQSPSLTKYSLQILAKHGENVRLESCPWFVIPGIY